MGKQYSHLRVEEHAVIMIQTGVGASARSVARRLRRSASSISREMMRSRAGAGAQAGYDATSAGQASLTRRGRCGRGSRVFEGSAMLQHVYDRLVYWRWSPQQIAARLRRMHPDDAAQRVSDDTIYAAIYAYPRGALKQGMVQALRQERPTRRRPRSTLSAGHSVPEAGRIVHRMADVAKRLVSGHLGGFIKAPRVRIEPPRESWRLQLLRE